MPPLWAKPLVPTNGWVGNLGRKGAAVRVAQADDGCPGSLGLLERLRGVLGIGPVAVEKVLRVVEYFAPGRLAVGHRVRDHPQVFFERCAEHFADVQIPGLADDRDDRRLRTE